MWELQQCDDGVTDLKELEESKPQGPQHLPEDNSVARRQHITKTNLSGFSKGGSGTGGY
jgi:hypothetical protein